MKVQVILYGTLPKGVAGYNHDRGLAVELPDGSSVGDLVDCLKISRSRLGLISVAGAPAKVHTRLKDRDCVKIFQPIAGG